MSLQPKKEDKVVVSFTFIDLENNCFAKSVNLDVDSSIREASIAVATEALEHGYKVYTEKEGTIACLSIFLTDDSQPGQSNFGIKYSLNDNGSLQVLNLYSPLLHDWSVGELRQMVQSGYLKGDFRALEIHQPVGLGAASADMFEWISFLSDLWSVGSVLFLVPRWVKHLIVRFKYRKMIKSFKQNHAPNPKDLREFMDLKAGWKLNEVKRLLSVNEEVAVKLLTSLGLEPKNDSWQLTHSRKSIKNRKLWMKSEQSRERGLD